MLVLQDQPNLPEKLNLVAENVATNVLKYQMKNDYNYFLHIGHLTPVSMKEGSFARILSRSKANLEKGQNEMKWHVLIIFLLQEFQLGFARNFS